MEYNEKVVAYYERITSALDLNEDDDDGYSAVIHALITVLATLGHESVKTQEQYCTDIAKQLYEFMSGFNRTKTLN